MANPNPSQNKRKESIRTPLVGLPLYRNVDDTKDQRYVNCFVETIKNPKSGATATYVTKRSGLDLIYNFYSVNVEGRGIYSWNGNLYSVFGFAIFKNGNLIYGNLTTNSGICDFIETSATSPVRYLAINDGTALYLVKSDDSVTKITTNFPSPNLRQTVFFDGYLVTATSDGKLFNSVNEDPTTWNPTDFIQAEAFSDNLVGIARQNNILLAFGDFSTEFFYDAANPTPGSFLGRLQQGALQIGCVSADTIAQHENLVIWASRAQTGKPTIQKLDGITQLTKISTAPIERIMAGEGSSITEASAFVVRSKGHFFYIINFAGINRTFAYDIDEDHWTEFDSTLDNSQGTGFPFIYGTQHNSETYLQHMTNASIYIWDQNKFEDDEETITVSIRTARNDYDNGLKKTCSRFELIGDFQPENCPVAIQYSDDDYKSFSFPRYVDMSQRAWLQRLGSFRRRAWLISHQANTDLRLEAFEVDLQKQEF